jgi:hypothetical protein
MDNKQINRDWTLREERIPRRKDVVFDSAGNLCIVTKTEGEFSKRYIYAEDISGEEIYAREISSSFRIATVEQTKNFYLSYKKNLGWIKKRIYTVAGKDYPLQLVDMDYDLIKQEMFYVFKDLNVPEQKFLRTLNESLVEKLPDWQHESAQIFNRTEPDSAFTHLINVQIEEISPEQNGWNVSGSEMSFTHRDLAEMEVRSWRSRLLAKRFAAVFSMSEKKCDAVVSMGEDGFLYVKEISDRIGQPAIFNSRVEAALAIVSLGEAVWADILNIELDKYDI